MAATAAVLHTAEVLEEILLLLPAPEVLVHSRVSRFWQATIKGSIRMKRALFLTPPKGSVIQPGPCMALDFHWNPHINCDFRVTCGLTKAHFKSHPTSSCRSMFITQPPSASIIVQCKVCLMHFTLKGLGDNPTGVVMGQLFNAAKAHLPLCRANGMCRVNGMCRAYEGNISEWRILLPRGASSGVLRKNLALATICQSLAKNSS
ncbi:hypothetical protein CERZMDRAFT_100391 [Cercospora zeae-maydis SCOH1-5]|uniref:F-box domain-containing protein n=1 Tax=Cercospora zeae-maydis SCOH1-5 TaxID=717836 RepID=A0A6A6F859_9PEZI|nr:hypothetical protein CERZMDRAFT_100391 [Cercospora zeae-maydis SCOH1-5]